MPRSPKLNGRVERAQRTHTEEFSEVTPCSWLIPELNRELRAGERADNTVRFHQALHDLTPAAIPAAGAQPTTVSLICRTSPLP